MRAINASLTLAAVVSAALLGVALLPRPERVPEPPPSLTVTVVQPAPAPAPAPAPPAAPTKPPAPAVQAKDAHATYRRAEEAKACSGALGVYKATGVQMGPFDRCAQYLDGEPLPDWRALQAQALAQGDLLARLNFQQGQALRDAMVDARESADPEVQFVLAWRLMGESHGTVPTEALALLVRACAGLNGCPVEDPRFGMGCLDRGTCASGMTVLDQMEQMFGAGVMQAARNEEQGR